MAVELMTIRFKNFLATGNVWSEVKLNQYRSTLITGENGSGKTTVLDALTFVLFGKPYRNINIPQLVNSINKRDCVVEIEFKAGSSNYKVRRGLAPRLFEIEKDGILVNQDAKVKDYQKMFEDQIIKMSYKSFCQVVILGSANFTPFMRLTANERRQVVENLLDIDVFSTMNVLLKGKLTTLKELQIKNEHQIDILKERAAAQNKHINALQKRVVESTDTAKEQILQEQAQVAELEQEFNLVQTKIDTTLPARQTLEKQMVVAEKELAACQREQAKLVSLIESTKSSTTCQTCGQSICEEHINKTVAELEKQLSELKNEVVEKERVFEEVQKKFKDHIPIWDEQQKHTMRLYEIRTEIRTKNQHIETLEKNMEAIGDDTLEAEKKKLKDIVELGTNALAEKKKIAQSLHYHSIVAHLLKDSGIKSKIIKHYLPIMNRVINKYLSDMDFFVQFELNEEFEETIKSRHRDEFSYHSFSEGEKRKIDLALLFAWRRIAEIKNSLNCNLLFFDEVLDGSLDDTATDAFLNILRTLGDKTNIYVISHKSKDLLQDKFEHHIQVTKKNNFTRMV